MLKSIIALSVFVFSASSFAELRGNHGSAAGHPIFEGPTLSEEKQELRDVFEAVIPENEQSVNLFANFVLKVGETPEGKDALLLAFAEFLKTERGRGKQGDAILALLRVLGERYDEAPDARPKIEDLIRKLVPSLSKFLGFGETVRDVRTILEQLSDRLKIQDGKGSFKSAASYMKKIEPGHPIQNLGNLAKGAKEGALALGREIKDDFLSLNNTSFRGAAARTATKISALVQPGATQSVTARAINLLAMGEALERSDSEKLKEILSRNPHLLSEIAGMVPEAQADLDVLRKSLPAAPEAQARGPLYMAMPNPRNFTR